MSSERKLTAEDKQSFEETAKLAFATTKLQRDGKYREAVQLMIQVPGIGVKTAIKMIKRSRIECRHNNHIWVGGAGGGGISYHFPHCKCGWHGKDIHGEDSYKKARKKICPNLKRELALYGLRYRKD